MLQQTIDSFLWDLMPVDNVTPHLVGDSSKLYLPRKYIASKSGVLSFIFRFRFQSVFQGFS